MLFFPNRPAAYLFVLFVLSSANLSGQEAGNQIAKTIEKSSLGSTINVHRAGDLFFAGQFMQQDLRVIRDNGFDRIITLRADGEINWNEQQAVKDAGIEFVKIPFRSPDELTDEVFDKIRKLLSDESRKTLFHCGSASRVGGVWLPFRVLDEGVDLETAIKEAEQIGLRTQFVKLKALAYIKRKQKSSLENAGDIDSETKMVRQSVKPGINDAFLNPNLDPDDFIQRFEVESREIFVSRENIVAACKIKPGEYVADVGAGTGLFTKLFANSVGSSGWVYAVDVSTRLVEHVNRETSKAKQDNVTTVLCAEDNINLPPNSVDIIFICDTYHHFEYPKLTMASVHRALKKNGRLVLIDFERISGVSRDFVMGHVRAGKDVFRAEIQDAGFGLRAEEKIEGLSENYFLIFRKM